MKSKKGNNKPAVPTIATFGKKKIKVGKILKKPNVTDSSIATKKVVLLEQLKNESATVVSHRGLSLEDLCKQLGHYNEGVRRDAIIGVKQLLESNRGQIPKNLRVIVPCVGNQISTGVGDSATRAHLKSLLKLVCEVPIDVISSHFDLFLTHVLKGLSDSQVHTRFFAFDTLLIIMDRYPSLCSRKSELFDGYLLLMSSARRPNKIANVLQSISLFLNIFGSSHQKSFWSKQDVELSVSEKRCTYIEPIIPCREAIEFAVIYGSSQQSESSPLYTASGLLRACEVLCTLIASSVNTEKQKGVDQRRVSNELNGSVTRLCELSAEFKQENCPDQQYVNDLEKPFNMLRKCPQFFSNKLLKKSS
uniref:Testis-expressed protein 10 n=1 Tax=Ditylenchus dipsaci TaxID=166011 RepID=A0A915ERU4_9BILA